MILWLPIDIPFTIRPIIFMAKKYRGAPNERAILAHEQTHYDRQEGQTCKWIKQYIKDRDFRLAEEVIAYMAQEKLENVPLTTYAAEIAGGHNRWWMCGLITYEQALRALQEAYDGRQD